MAEFDSVIPAGGSGTLTAKVETTIVQQGKVSKSVTVYTDAPGYESFRLIVSFEAVASIIASPRLRLNLNVVQGEEGSARILLHRPDGKRLEVGETEAGTDTPVDLKIVGVPVTERTTVRGGGSAEPGDVWLEAVMAPHEEPLRWTGRVTVETNHPDAQQLEIPVTVWVQPLFDVRPERVNLWVPDDATETRPVTVRVTHADRKPFEITEMEVSHPELFSVTALTVSDRRFHTFRVQLNNAIAASQVSGVVTGTLRLHTTDPDEPVIDIQVGIQPLQNRLRRPPTRDTAQTGTPVAGGGHDGG